MTRLDPTRCAEWLRETAAQGLVGPWPRGAPARDYQRSPAAAAVGRLAALDGLFAFHFEHRRHLDLPERWSSREDPMRWTQGVLAERKYQSFRHELAVASFHPGHRSKWGTHELCHALVGFSWSANATPLFHATAARVAELLPVALWYFFDEAFLRRCPDHEGGGGLYRTLCPGCERVAAPWLNDPWAVAHIEDGLAFVEGELDAVRRTLKDGRPVPHVVGTLDLCSDGLAYARAHHDRLNSEVFAMWMDRFAVDGGGWSPSIPTLIERLEAVLAAVLMGADLEPLCPPDEHDRWMRQDLGARLLQVLADTDGECATALLGVVDGLASGDPIERVVAAYAELEIDWYVPETQSVFACGYPIEQTGHGSDIDQLSEGLRSALPATCLLAGDELSDWVRGFAPADRWERRGLGRRFAAFLLRRGPLIAAELARFEACLAHPLPTDVDRNRVLGVGQGPWRLAEGVEVLRFAWDVVALRDAVLSGETPPEPSGVVLVVGTADGERVMAEVDTSVADAVEAGRVPDGAVMAELAELGLCTPARWALTAPSPAA